MGSQKNIVVETDVVIIDTPATEIVVKPAAPELRRSLKAWLGLKKPTRATINALAIRAQDGTLYTEAEYDALISARNTLVSGAQNRS